VILVCLCLILGNLNVEIDTLLFQLEAAPGTFIYIFVYLMLCHCTFLIVLLQPAFRLIFWWGIVYTICFLVTLNGRDFVKSGSEPVSSDVVLTRRHEYVSSTVLSLISGKLLHQSRKRKRTDPSRQTLPI